MVQRSAVSAEAAPSWPPIRRLSQSLRPPIFPPPSCPPFLPSRQDILAREDGGTDASGNPVLQDVGVWLRNEVKRHFKDVDVKYIDP